MIGEYGPDASMFGASMRTPRETREEPIGEGIAAQPPAEKFLQQALGTTSDVRLPSLLLTAAAAVAVVAVAIRRWRDRRPD